MQFPHLLEQISQVLTFMWSEVFCGNTEVRTLNKTPIFFPVEFMDHCQFIQFNQNIILIINFNENYDQKCLTICYASLLLCPDGYYYHHFMYQTYFHFISFFPQIIKLFSVKLCGGPRSFLLDPLIDCLTNMVPKSESELIQFQKSIEKPCQDFELKLVALELLDPSSSGSDCDLQSKGSDKEYCASSVCIFVCLFILSFQDHFICFSLSLADIRSSLCSF